MTEVRLPAARGGDARADDARVLFEALLGNAPVGLGFWDLELRYLRVNETLAAINGLPADEHVGRTLHEVIPKLATRVEEICRGVPATGEPSVHLELTG